MRHCAILYRLIMQKMLRTAPKIHRIVIVIGFCAIMMISALTGCCAGQSCRTRYIGRRRSTYLYTQPQQSCRHPLYFKNTPHNPPSALYKFINHTNRPLRIVARICYSCTFLCNSFLCKRGNSFLYSALMASFYP